MIEEVVSFNDEFAMRMPGIIIAEQLGLSRDDVATFKKWADSMLGASRTPIATKEEVTKNAKIELEAQLFLAVFEERRKNPREDSCQLWFTLMVMMRNLYQCTNYRT